MGKTGFDNGRKYEINEIFCSLQGEGLHTGMAAVFVRFSGCNLKCSFCDTDFKAKKEMTIQQIIDAVDGYATPHVILTGGEPAMQVDETLVEALHSAGKRVYMETNGTLPVPKGIDWVTCSPKCAQLERLHIEHVDEIKVVYTGQNMKGYNDMVSYYKPASLRLQPCDTGDAQKNAELTQGAINYIMEHQQWRLSLQTHKLINIK